MYFGQGNLDDIYINTLKYQCYKIKLIGLKEFFCEPRPQQPAVQLQTKWALEYGLPSTHAMAAISIPSALIIYTMNT